MRNYMNIQTMYEHIKINNVDNGSKGKIIVLFDKHDSKF